jgi:molecular chaperone GrpE
MGDRTTRHPAAEDGRAGGNPEARGASAVSEHPESQADPSAGAEQQRDEYLELLQRTRADFENYQKRTQRALAQERREALAAFARELLPVLDNLQRALDAALEQADEGPLSRGVALVRSQMLDVLGRSGIFPIEAMGRPFDPHFHESLGQQPRSDVAPDTVIEVLEPGYRFHDRVLRPARVIVAAPAESDGRESA